MHLHAIIAFSDELLLQQLHTVHLKYIYAY